MVNVKKITSVLTIFSLFLVLTTVLHERSVWAQSCNTSTPYESASSTLRSVELPDFGIKVDIPSNYRTMKRQDDSVLILNPKDYEFLQCMASPRGSQRDARGLYSEQIQLITREAAAQTLQNLSTESEFLEYKQGKLSGYLITTSRRSSTMFVGSVSGSEKFLLISVGCDCEVNVQDLSNLLGRISILG